MKKVSGCLGKFLVFGKVIGFGICEDFRNYMFIIVDCIYEKIVFIWK